MPTASRLAASSLLPRLLLGADIALALCVAALMVLFYTSGSSETTSALDTGKRLLVAVKDGSITGNMRSSKPKETSEAPVSPAFDVATDEEENKTPQGTVSAETAADVSSLVATEEEAVENIRVNPRTAASLPQAPIDGLTEASPFGPVPASSATSSPLFAYARPYTPPASPRPMLAIVITDLGAQNTLTDSIISLPADITLAFSPYSKQAALWTQSARNMGHESWLMLPVQSAGFPANDPGPLAQLAALKPEENASRLLQVLARSVGYTGLVLPPDETLSESAEKLEAPLSQISARGLGLLSVRLSDKTQAHGILNNLKQHRIVANAVLDDTLDTSAIAHQFDELADLAVRKGSAVGVLRPYPVSIHALEDWLSGKGKVSTVQLVPLSALLREEN